MYLERINKVSHWKFRLWWGAYWVHHPGDFTRCYKFYHHSLTVWIPKIKTLLNHLKLLD
jgi:hypothetical protein